MFRKKFKVEVVPTAEYTDFSDRLQSEDNKYATKNTLIAASLIPITAAVPLTLNYFSKTDTFTPESTPVAATITATEPSINFTQMQSPSFMPDKLNNIPSVIPNNSNIVSDATLEILMRALDPVIDIMIALSFPIASVIMVGACFFFMFGNSEKAWDMIMKAGLGYVLIQMSPLFLKILSEVGKAV